MENSTRKAAKKKYLLWMLRSSFDGYNRPLWHMGLKKLERWMIAWGQLGMSIKY
jgi:hypothetical protein